MNAKSVYYIYSIQLICLVTTYIRGACASHCITICLGWSISRSNLTITCKISDLHFAVHFYHPDGYEVGSCFQPTTTSDCKITHKFSDSQRNYAIKQNLVTNETYLIVKGNINHKINGKWTCRHGTRKQKENVEVNVLELKELGKAENKRTVCYITLTVLLLVTIGFIVVTRLTLGLFEMINEKRMFRDRTDFISCEVRIGTIIDRRYKKLEKRTRQHCGWLTITGLKLVTLILMTLFDLALVIPATFNKFGNCTVPYILISVQAAYGISIVFIFLRNGGYIRRNSDTEIRQQETVVVSANDEETQIKDEDKDSRQREDNTPNDIHEQIPFIDE